MSISPRDISGIVWLLQFGYSSQRHSGGHACVLWKNREVLLIMNPKNLLIQEYQVIQSSEDYIKSGLLNALYIRVPRLMNYRWASHGDFKPGYSVASPKKIQHHCSKNMSIWSQIHLQNRKFRKRWYLLEQVTVHKKFLVLMHRRSMKRKFKKINSEYY
jgi:hypothetical protein